MKDKEELYLAMDGQARISIKKILKKLNIQPDGFFVTIGDDYSFTLRPVVNVPLLTKASTVTGVLLDSLSPQRKGIAVSPIRKD